MAKFDGYEILGNVTNVEKSKVIMIDWYPTSTPAEDVILWNQSLDGLQGYWTGYHDKDLKADGTPADPHFHSVYWLNTPKSELAFARWLVRTNCPMVKPVNPNGVVKFALWKDVRDAVRYLEHLDDKTGKAKYDNLAQIDGLNSSDAKSWLETPLTASHDKNHAGHDYESERKSRSILDVMDIIHEQDICTFTELLCYARQDSMIVRCVRENPYLVRRLLEENMDCTIKWSKSTNNGTIQK